MKIIFESERILFIEPEESYIHDCLDMKNHPNVQKFINHEFKEYTYESELFLIKQQISLKLNNFYMIEKGSNRFIGQIMLNEIKDNNVGELGIVITPSMQNKHYGEEAMKSFMNYLLDKYHLDGFDLYTYYFNTRAINCYKKVGFSIEGIGDDPDDMHMVCYQNKKSNIVIIGSGSPRLLDKLADEITIGTIRTTDKIKILYNFFSFPEEKDMEFLHEPDNKHKKG